jgi:glyoxylase I family protein
MTRDLSTSTITPQDLGIIGFHGVRYLVTDVKRALEFYAERLGFTIEHQQLPAFATVALGSLKIHLSGPQASGSRPLPGGRDQSPGGSNRVILRVRDLAELIGTLRNSGMTFRNAMETGPGGKQIQIEDPDGNPIELFQPASLPGVET